MKMKWQEVESLIWIAFVLAAVVGWVMNIVAIAGAESITGMVVVRLIGVFMAPLGAALGYF
jgi:hypothetical protein